MATADWGDGESLAGVGEVVALWRTDEEAAASAHSFLRRAGAIRSTPAVEEAADDGARGAGVHVKPSP